MQYKGYSDDEPIGARLWDRVQQKLGKMQFFQRAKDAEANQFTLENLEGHSPRYRDDVLSRVRIGQGAFRMMITQAYQGRCAVTGEHTLPVLEAAHIKPFSESGPSIIANGLLLRSDLHKLFDTGYITITTDYRLEVSKRLKDEFDNGRIYYDMNGQRLLVTPHSEQEKPNQRLLEWHNENIYKAG